MYIKDTKVCHVQKCAMWHVLIKDQQLISLSHLDRDYTVSIMSVMLEMENHILCQKLNKEKNTQFNISDFC